MPGTFGGLLQGLPRASAKLRNSIRSIRPLFMLGGWMTVSNVVGPLMVYLDRFVIGGIISISAVAYYATPYELVTKLWILPAAIVGVLFPAFAAIFAADQEQTLRLLIRGAKYVALALFPCAFLISALAPEGLTLWLGTYLREQ